MTEEEKSNQIKSQLPPNIQIGGKIINTGTITVDGEEIPQEKKEEVGKK